MRESENFWHRLWYRQFRRPYRLAVRQHSSSGPTLIFLHGIAASSDKWNELIPLLKGSYRCITIDLLGFGKSPKPQWLPYTLEDHLRSLHVTLKKLGLHEDYTLIGHSLGSFLATRYTRKYPRHIDRLLLLSPPVYPPLKDIKGRVARRRTELFLKLYKFMRSHPRVTPANFKRLSYILPLPRSVIQDPDTWIPFRRTLEHCIEQQTILQDIRDIKIPIEVFYGTLDQVVIADNVEALDVIPGVRFRKVRGANHDIGKRYAKAVYKTL